VADAALYSAKREGKDLVRAHRPGVVELDSRRDNSLRLAERLAARLGIPAADVAAALAAEARDKPLRAAL
jgi:hypothetical protein